jgi:type II secretory pathway component PulM
MGSLDRFQLRPQERRLVVVGTLILFVVLNFWFVWPHYGDLRRVRAQMERTRTTLDAYRVEVARTNQFLVRLLELEQQGTAVLDADKEITLLSTVQAQANRSGVGANSLSPASRAPGGGTNEFFEQRAIRLVLNATAPEPLIAFLEGLATNSVTLRVKELDLKADQSRSRLSATLQIVASFPRQPVAPKPAPPASPTNPSPRT